MNLRFHIWYYTTNPDTMFDTQYTTTGGAVSHLVTLVNNSHVEYAFLYLDGFQAGTTYNLEFINFRMSGVQNFILKQAYIQSSNGNLNLMDSFNGTTNINTNFDFSWSSADQRIVLYFEYPDPTTPISSVGIEATLVSALPISYGGNSDNTQVIDNTGQTAENTAGIWTTISSVLHEIIDLPHKIVRAIADMIKDLLIPDPDDMHTIIENFKTSMSGKLGFVYQVYTLAYNFFNGITASQSGVIRFPGISFPMGGTTYVIAQPQDVDITQNELASSLLPICKTVISMIMVIWVVNLGLKSFLDLASGKWG